MLGWSKLLGKQAPTDRYEELKGFSPSEGRAILVHRYYLGLEYNKEPSLKETIASWEKRFATAWRKKKIDKDLRAQLKEIERHKYFLSEKAGVDVGWEAAARDWIKIHASAWREWWERQPDSEP